MRLHFFRIGSELKFHEGLQLDSFRLDQLLPSYLLKTDLPLKFSIRKCLGANRSDLSYKVVNYAVRKTYPSHRPQAG